MKKLSDYKDDEAIELWADLLDPLTAILTDEEIRKVISYGKSRMDIAKAILKKHKSEALEIMLRVDPEPVNGLNIVMRLIALLADIGSNDEIKSFFGYAEAANTENKFSGSATVSIEDDGK